MWIAIEELNKCHHGLPEFEACGIPAQHCESCRDGVGAMATFIALGVVTTNQTTPLNLQLSTWSVWGIGDSTFSRCPTVNSWSRQSMAFPLKDCSILVASISPHPSKQQNGNVILDVSHSYLYSPIVHLRGRGNCISRERSHISFSSVTHSFIYNSKVEQRCMTILLEMNLSTP